MYFIKTKGTDKVPDYVQVRDESFALVEHIKLSFLEKKLKEFTEKDMKNSVEKIFNSDYGTILKIDVNE